jgi:hypothetical protein
LGADAVAGAPDRANCQPARRPPGPPPRSLLPAKLVTEAVLVTAGYRIQRGVVFAAAQDASEAAPREAVAVPG